MALRRSTCAAIYIFVSHALGRCSAAKAVPTNGRPTQAVVGPDGVLAQAAASTASAAHEEQAQVMRRAEEQLPHTAAAAADPRMPAAALSAVAAVAVDPAGRSQPATQPAAAAQPAGAALADAGFAADQPSWPGKPDWLQPPRYGRVQAQYGQPTYGQQQPSTWGRAAASAAPVSVGSGAPMGSFGAPMGSAAPTAMGRMCDMPMWGGRPLLEKEKYACEEYESYKSMQGYTWIDKAGNTRIRVPEAVKCTVAPASAWMTASVDSMICQGGTWVAEGKHVTEIECTTAYWFTGLMVTLLLASLLTIYKLKYDQESALYAWWHGTSKEPLLEDTSGAESNVQDDQQQQH